MSIFDIIVIAFVALAIVHGVTQGAAMQMFSFGGFWGGLVIGAVLGPPLSGLARAPFLKSFISLASLFGLAALGGGFGRLIGARVWSALRRVKLGAIDAAAGAAIAALATLVAVWLFVIVVSEGPVPEVSRVVNNSAIARWLVTTMPPAPNVFSRIQALVNTTPFPKVFAGFEPKPQPVELPSDPTVRAAVGAAGDSTVRVFGAGCGGVQTGSGFLAAPGLVVTNAHVVAGIRSLRIEQPNGREIGGVTPLVFDPNLDIAVLRVPGLRVKALPIARGQVARGTGGAVLGYPAGGRFTARAGAVLGSFEAVGRDIYGGGLSRRQVYQLQAVIRPGNSGGPFVSTNGEVYGVVFAASTTDLNVGYAIAGSLVAAKLDQAENRQSAVATGPCAA